MMVDMSQFIAAKSDQLGAEDLVSGPRTITITRVTGNASPEQPVNIWFQGDNGKPWRPCKTARRVLVRAWGADASQYAGRSLTLYRDPKVKFGGMEVGGIRISAMSHINGPLEMALLASHKKMQAVKIEPLRQRPAQQKPAAVEEATGPAPVDDAGEAAAPASGGLFTEPDHVETAAALDRRYRECRDMDELRQLWTDTADARKRVIAADDAFRDVFAKVLEREKARLAGDVA